MMTCVTNLKEVDDYFGLRYFLISGIVRNHRSTYGPVFRLILFSGSGGEGRSRTADTGIFSRDLNHKIILTNGLSA